MGALWLCHPLWIPQPPWRYGIHPVHEHADLLACRPSRCMLPRHGIPSAPSSLPDGDDGPHETTGKECYSWVIMAVPPLDRRFVALPLCRYLNYLGAMVSIPSMNRPLGLRISIPEDPINQAPAIVKAFPEILETADREKRLLLLGNEQPTPARKHTSGLHTMAGLCASMVNRRGWGSTFLPHLKSRDPPHWTCEPASYRPKADPCRPSRCMLPRDGIPSAPSSLPDGG